MIKRRKIEGFLKCTFWLFGRAGISWCHSITEGVAPTWDTNTTKAIVAAPDQRKSKHAARLTPSENVKAERASNRNGGTELFASSKIWSDQRANTVNANKLKRQHENEVAAKAKAQQKQAEIQRAKGKAVTASTSIGNSSSATNNPGKRISGAALSGIIGMVVVTTIIAQQRPNADFGVYIVGALMGCLVFGLLYRFLLGAVIGALLSGTALAVMLPNLSNDIVAIVVLTFGLCAGLAHRFVLAGTKATGRTLLFAIKASVVVGFLMVAVIMVFAPGSTGHG